MVAPLDVYHNTSGMGVALNNDDKRQRQHRHRRHHHSQQRHHRSTGHMTGFDPNQAEVRVNKYIVVNTYGSLCSQAMYN